MPAYNRPKFALDFPKGLGNKNPSTNIRKFIMGWISAEFGGGSDIGCANNPLATCYGMPGDSPCNAPHCVRNYKSYQDGLDANLRALSLSYYNSLRHALATNDENNLGFHGHKMAGNIAGDLSMWVHGKRTPVAQSYIDNILSAAGVANPTITNTGSGNGSNPPPTDNSPETACLGCGAKDSQPWKDCISQYHRSKTYPACAKPAQVQGIDLSIFGPLNDFFAKLNALLANPLRLVKGMLGVALIIAGLYLLIQTLLPGQVKQVAGAIAKVAAL
jgi:hypothetical protein